ncbi:unnamed protein product [Symbiodinium sp. CCMP2592]|nr:unnamed protein product [Symbiodinium sp. CCMP2592]
MWEKALVALAVLLNKGLEPSRGVWPVPVQCSSCECHCFVEKEPVKAENPESVQLGWRILISGALGSNCLVASLAFFCGRGGRPEAQGPSGAESLSPRLLEDEPGRLLRVWYSDDDVWHERLVLLPGRRADVFWIVTPDIDIYEENLAGNASGGPEKVRELAHGARTRYSRPVYKFRAAWREHSDVCGMPPEIKGLSVDLPEGSEQPLERLLGGPSTPRRRLTGKGHRDRGAQAAFGDIGPGVAVCRA